MILDDLFEQKPLPAHIRPSDLPPGMRPRLTMRDVEKERPRGAYRYRVIPGTPGESPKDFLDLPGAEEYAQAVRGRVQPLEEQADDPDVQRGMINLNAIEKAMNINQKVLIQNETGRPEYQIELPVDKQWIISHAQEWIDAGRAKDLYKYMGTTAGFDFLLSAWQKEDVIRNKSRRKDVTPEEPDLFSRQAGAPKAPRYQDESQHGQKKRVDIAEAPQGARGRTERMMAQMRARQPQATSDLEALAYELQDAETRDAQEIDKLEKDVNDLETDIKSDLQKRIATLTRRRGDIRQAAASDTKIDATLDQLARVNDQQQREINDLTRAVAGLGQATTVIAPGREQTKAADVTPRVAVATQPRSKTVEPPEQDRFGAAVVAPLQSQPKSTPTTKAEPPIDQDQTAVDQTTPDIQPTGQVITPDVSAWKTRKRAAESVDEGVLDKIKQSQFAQDFKTVAGLYKGAGLPGSRFIPGAKTAQPAAAVPAATPTAATQPTSSIIDIPQDYRRRTPQQQTALQDIVTQVSTMTPAQKAVIMPSGWQQGQPIRIGKQVIGPRDPNYAKIVAAMGKQPVAEKKKPMPTNPDLWSRAKSAARSKFDVYPSAYANAWAAKWYKSKGGGWRMSKSKKK